MLTTERLIIRPIEKLDYEDICEYGSDVETGQFMLHWPKSREQVEKYIDNCISKMISDELTWYEFVMLLKDERKVIGNITLEVRELVAEIGWISNKEYWNNGYMSEAVNAIIEHAFSNLGIERIFATCNEKNVASYKVMEKCNMFKIKTENDHKSYRHGIPVIFDRLIYCIER
jgi:ribosomal-protein-alanine N-acetyltransferase